MLLLRRHSVRVVSQNVYQVFALLLLLAHLAALCFLGPNLRGCFGWRTGGAFHFALAFGHLLVLCGLHFCILRKSKEGKGEDGRLCLILPSVLVSAEQLCGRTLSVFIHISY